MQPGAHKRMKPTVETDDKVIYKGVRMPKELVARAKERTPIGGPSCRYRKWGGQATDKVVFGTAVDNNLTGVVMSLLRAGHRLTNDPPFQRRAFYQSTYMALVRAEELTGVSVTEILRCCLVVSCGDSAPNIDIAESVHDEDDFSREQESLIPQRQKDFDFT